MRVTVHRQRPHDLLLSLIACCATVLTPDASHAAGSPSVMVSMAQLRTLGIALDLSAIAPAMRVKVPPGADRPFPNRCFGMVTVSDELLRQMQAQGFSLATLCIGLDSPHVAFHPETGAPLTSIRVRYGKREKDGPDKILELLIQVPRCFARGDPYGDCKMRYGWMEGERHQKDEVDYFARSGKRIAELMRLMNAKGAFQRECSCTDFRVPDTDFDLGPEPREGIICKATKEPACPRPLSRFSTPGSMVYDFDSGRLGSDTQLVKRLGLPASTNQADWGLLNEVFEVSPDLPLGYAYRVMTPEGETAKEMVTQEKGRVTSVGTK